MSVFKFRSRFRLFFTCLFVSILLLLLFQRKSVYYKQLCQLEIFRESNTNWMSGNQVKYNLMEDTIGLGKLTQFFANFEMNQCSLDYINTNKLPQDHPCVIETIRKSYLKNPPSPIDSYNLDANGVAKDRSPGETGIIFRLLRNKTEGFFVECGAMTGEYISNTIGLEQKFNWGGILMEANPINYQKLVSSNRQAYTLPICLSLEPYPTNVSLKNPGIPGRDSSTITVQCFPFYSVLLAVGRTHVDFFSLNAEGYELEVLNTIPWHKVDIKSLTFEWGDSERQDALIRFMEAIGYIKIGAFDLKYNKDVLTSQLYFKLNL